MTPTLPVSLESESAVSNRLELLPAVDVRDGQAVRLVHGESGSETSYGDPLEAALAWQRAGAEWLHLVDLDAAFGTGDNRAQIAEVAGAMDIKVELSGGIRDDASLEAALATGCRRVNLGTAALESPEWVAKVIAEHGDKIAVGLGALVSSPLLRYIAASCSYGSGAYSAVAALIHWRRSRTLKWPSLGMACW